MIVPVKIFENLREKLWAEADEVGWTRLTDQAKTALYERWIKDQEIGGVLSRYSDISGVRVYIKDTLMKPYGRDRIKEHKPIFKSLDIEPDAPCLKEFVKPHGRILLDGRVICWGPAKNWKSVIMAVFERARRRRRARPHAAVLLDPSGKTAQLSERELIQDASDRLGIEKLVWHD